AGVGELKLVTPAAARLTQAQRWITMIAPPHVPYAPAFTSQGIRLQHLLLVNPEAAEDKLWAAQQALAASCCGAVLLWQEHVNERMSEVGWISDDEGDGSLEVVGPGSRVGAWSDGVDDGGPGLSD